MTIDIAPDQAEEVYRLIEDRMMLEKQLIGKSTGKVQNGARREYAFLRRLRSKVATAIHDHYSQVS